MFDRCSLLTSAFSVEEDGVPQSFAVMGFSVWLHVSPAQGKIQ